MNEVAVTDTSAELAQDIESELRALGTDERAEGSKRYLKSDLEFLGATVPQIRAVARSALKQCDPGPRADRRLGSNALEGSDLRAAVGGGRGLERFRRRVAAADLSFAESLIRDARTWALVDPLAMSVAGPTVERFRELADVLDRWARDDDFWVRRSAMLALLPGLRRGEGDWQRFARYADEMLEEREFFIRKAIGWVLREAGKARPELVYEWMRPRATRASGVTIREAVKPLSPEQRDELIRVYEGR